MDLQLFAERMIALRAACRDTHKEGPGGAAHCICGANGGGSAACSALAEIASLLAVAKVPSAYRERLREAQHWIRG